MSDRSANDLSKEIDECLDDDDEKEEIECTSISIRTTAVHRMNNDLCIRILVFFVKSISFQQSTVLHDCHARELLSICPKDFFFFQSHPLVYLE